MIIQTHPRVATSTHARTHVLTGMTHNLFDGLSGSQKYRWLNMSHLRGLMQFGRGNAEIQAVFNVCYTAISSSGPIMIKPLSEIETQSSGSGARVVLPDARAEADDRARSNIFADWGREAAFMEACIGFFVTTGVPDSSSPDGMRPVVLNLARVEVQHHVDVYGQHFWRWYELTDEDGGAHSVTGNMPHRVLLPNVRVVGSSLPDSEGVITSRVNSVLNGEWAIYQAKKRLTMLADAERARPTLVLQQHDASKDRIPVSSGEDSALDRDVMMETCTGAQAVHRLVYQRNMGADDATQESATRTQQQQQEQRMSTFDITDGRVLVQNHMAVAPSELPVSRLAYFESVCLAWSVPMAMLTSGDSSGKAKLNADTATPETGRLFREAQSDRKRLLERNICDMYEFMHHERLHEESYSRAWRQEWRRKGMAKKRKRSTPEEMEEHMEDDEGLGDAWALSERSVAHGARMSVQIPCIGTSDQLRELLDMGVLRYDAYVAINAQQMGLSMRSYNTTRTMPDAGGDKPAKKPAKKAHEKSKTKT